MNIKIISLNLGKPQQLTDYKNQPFMSAIRKGPTDNEVFLSKSGLSGDTSHEDFHGGTSRAVHVFCHDNYAFYNDKAGFELRVPAFGENLTVAGYDEQNANVGDILSIGEAIVQVSQPTERCGKIGQSLGLPKMLKWIHQEQRTGFYFRVLEEGNISAAATLQRIEQGPTRLNVAALNQLLFKQLNRAELDGVLQSALLSPEWKQRAEILYKRAGL